MSSYGDDEEPPTLDELEASLRALKDALREELGRYVYPSLEWLLRAHTWLSEWFAKLKGARGNND